MHQLTYLDDDGRIRTTISRPVEVHNAYPQHVKEHGTLEPERVKKDYADNRYDWRVYNRGQTAWMENNRGELVEYIRCQHCGELLEARRWNFAPDERNKSGFRHVCRTCYNQRERSRQWAKRNLPNVAYQRTRHSSS